MAAFPLINGDYFAFTNIELNFNGLLFAGVKSINYSDTLGRSKVRGTAKVPLGVTAGHYEAQGDMELYLNAAQLLITSLGPGWKQIPGIITVSYGPNVGMIPPAVVDVIPGVLLSSMEASNGEGEDALTRKFNLVIPGQILWNGIPSIIETNILAAIG